MSNRTQSVRFGNTTSRPTDVDAGVAQGSVLGPLLFVLYTADFIKIVERHGLRIHAYADDIQLYGFCTPSMKNDLRTKLSNCLDSLVAWFSSNRLRINIAKTEYMWCASKRRHQIVTFEPIRIGSLFPPPAPRVKCLGVIVDSEVSLIPQVSKTVSLCFASLRQIRSVRKSLTTSLLITLVQSLVLPRLDYCISVFSGLPCVQIRRLQAVLHAAARTIFRSSRFCHVTPLLRSLEWLPVEARIQLRLVTLVQRCIHYSEIHAAYVSDISLLVIGVYHPFWGNAAKDNERLDRVISIIIDHAYTTCTCEPAKMKVAVCGHFNDLHLRFDELSRLTQLTPVVRSPTRDKKTLDQISSEFLK